MAQRFSFLLFDLDETLLDFHLDSSVAFRQMCELNGIISPEESYSVYQRHNAICWAQAERNELSLEKLRWLRFKLMADELSLQDTDPIELGKSYLEELSKQANLIEGAVDSLSAFAKTCSLAIITNGLHEVQRPRLAAAGLTQFFSDIFVSDEIGLKKPQLAYFEYVLRMLGNPSADQCLVIGDSLTSDISGAISAGIHSCLFNRRGIEIPDDGPQPTYTVRNHAELRQLFLG